MTSTEIPLPSVALIAAGKCPGWDSWNMIYRADSRGGVPRCVNRISRGDLCGTCDNTRARALKEIERREVVAAQRIEAMTLADDLTTLTGIHFVGNGQGVHLTNEDAAALIRLVSELAASRDH